MMGFGFGEWAMKGVGIKGLGKGAYSISSSKFLLSSDDSTTSLSSVERTLASHDGLTSSSASTGPASNLRDGIPVIHDEQFERYACFLEKKFRLKMFLSDCGRWGERSV
jgi:hypothetical protein